MAQDYYGILGVPRDASPQDIKKAFRTIARECHPDVAGQDDGAADRFKTARKAYETLIDPVTRARYDKRGQRRAGPAAGSFFDAFYKATGDPQRREGAPSYGAHDAGGHGSARDAAKNPKNDLDLDDLFNSFGFGGEPRRKRPAEAPASPVPGPDVHLELDVPARIAAGGGSVTAVYHRMQRTDSWRPGASDPGLVRVQDIADVRIIPGTRDGQVLRERGLGDAGPNGGPYGDLLVRVRIVGRPPPPPPPRPEAPEATSGEAVVDVSLVEALLGGRVELATPRGEVRLTIPPGTSSDTRLRLKGRGPVGPDGVAGDLHVRVRIVVPRALDEESRRLIEEFARLNPQNPRD